MYAHVARTIIVVQAEQTVETPARNTGTNKNFERLNYRGRFGGHRKSCGPSYTALCEPYRIVLYVLLRLIMQMESTY